MPHSTEGAPKNPVNPVNPDADKNNSRKKPRHAPPHPKNLLSVCPRRCYICNRQIARPPPTPRNFWTKPNTQVTNEHIKLLETELWNAADSLRANSKLTAAEYKDPILGLVFLRFAQNIYEEKKVLIEQSIPEGPRGKRAITKDDFLICLI